MSKVEVFEQASMESDSDEYYEDIKQDGNGAIQQSMKHFQPTSKILSKYVRRKSKTRRNIFFVDMQRRLI